LKILAGEFSNGDTVHIDHSETGQYTFTKK
jgi:hypothetical protein